MSLLGQQTDEDDNKDSGIEGLLGTLLDNVDVGELLVGLLSDDSSSSKKKTTKKKSASSDDSNNLLSNLLGSLLK